MPFKDYLSETFSPEISWQKIHQRKDEKKNVIIVCNKDKATPGSFPPKTVQCKDTQNHPSKEKNIKITHRLSFRLLCCLFVNDELIFLFNCTTIEKKKKNWVWRLSEFLWHRWWRKKTKTTRRVWNLWGWSFFFAYQI